MSFNVYKLWVYFKKLLVEANKILDEIAVLKGVECAAPRTTARLLDKVSG